MKRLAAVVFCAVIGGSCQATTTPTQPTAGAASTVVTAYLNNIIELMRTNSINRLTIDWQAFRSEVFREAGAAQAISDLSPAIRLAITMLRDGHSSYRSAAGTTIFVSLRSCAPAPLTTLTAPSNIGTVRVTGFSGSGEVANAFARQIQDAIRAADRDDLIGWIVDLRSNGGGNMWPMIAGIGPIVGEGPLGYFIDPLGAETLWEYPERVVVFRQCGSRQRDASVPVAAAAATGRGALERWYCEFGGSHADCVSPPAQHPVVRRSHVRIVDRQRHVYAGRRRHAHSDQVGDGRPGQEPVRRPNHAGRSVHGSIAGHRAGDRVAPERQLTRRVAANVPAVKPHARIRPWLSDRSDAVAVKIAGSLEVTDNRGVELETDTTPQAQAVLTDKLRSMTAEQKLDLALRMSRTVRDLAVAGIRLRHPGASNREMLLRLAIVQHGRALAMAAYPDIADLDGP